MGLRLSKTADGDTPGAEGRRSALTLEEVQLIRELFSRAGVGRGQIAESQLASIVRMLGIDVPSKLLYRLFDVNKDGKVAPREVIQLLTLFLYGDSNELVYFLFNFHDANGDGKIDTAELGTLFEFLDELYSELCLAQSAQRRPTPRTATSLALERHDVDGDGAIDLEEFQDLVRCNPLITMWSGAFTKRAREGLDSLRGQHEERLVLRELERMLEDEDEAEDGWASIIRCCSVDVALLSTAARKRRFIDSRGTQGDTLCALAEDNKKHQRAASDTVPLSSKLDELVSETQQLKLQTIESSRAIQSVPNFKEICYNDILTLDVLRQKKEVHRFRIPYDALKFGRHIGSGAEGEVFQGEWLNLPVAIKVIGDASSELPRVPLEERLTVESEMHVLANLRHPNIMLYLGAVLEPERPMCIVTDYMSGGSLYSHLHERHNGTLRHLPMTTRLKIGLDICRGVLYLHSREPAVLHRDLKPENVLLDDEDQRAVLADFGLSVTANDTKSVKSHTRASAATVAPELVGGGPYTTASDVYALGIILWEIMTRRVPYDGLTAPIVLFKVSKEGYRPEYEAEDLVPISMRRLISSLWHEDPHARPAVVEAAQALRNELAYAGGGFRTMRTN